MSDADSTGPAKKELTPLQKRIRREARQKAAAAGLDWKSMSKEDRNKMKQDVRQGLKAAREERKAKQAAADT